MRNVKRTLVGAAEACAVAVFAAVGLLLGPSPNKYTKPLVEPRRSLLPGILLWVYVFAYPPTEGECHGTWTKGFAAGGRVLRFLCCESRERNH